MKTATTSEISPAALLQQLIRFDTSNPPGNERACVEFIGSLLLNAGIETQFLAKTGDRPNLIARLPGNGQNPPLLMYGHADVVPVAGQEWSKPPFEGVLSEGTIWGRGALDMKGGLAMMIAAMLRAKSSGFTPAGDILLAVVSDEEAGGDFGAGFLVEEHPGLFRGVRYAISEFGGFSLQVAGKRFYPIQVAEKQPCWMRATLHGPGGHGAMPVRDGAMAGLGKLLTVLNRKQLPLHVTFPARSMISAMGSNLGGVSKFLFYL